MTKENRHHWLRTIAHRMMVGGGAIGLSLAFFMVLPLMQAAREAPAPDKPERPIIEVALQPPPDPPKTPEPPKPPVKPVDPPDVEIVERPPEIPPLDPNGTGVPWTTYVPVVPRPTVAPAEGAGGIIGINDLDQKPRALSQPSPMLTDEIRRKLQTGPGTVYVIFLVDQSGNVVDPQVQRSSDAVFEKAALSAVKQWKFEPGKRNGQPVRFRMRVPITFPKG